MRVFNVSLYMRLYNICALERVCGYTSAHAYWRVYILFKNYSYYSTFVDVTIGCLFKEETRLSFQ